MLDEICDHMDGFSSAEEAWLSSITETLRTWRYVMQETYESPEDKQRRLASFVETHRLRFLFAVPKMKFNLAELDADRRGAFVCGLPCDGAKWRSTAMPPPN